MHLRFLPGLLLALAAVAPSSAQTLDSLFAPYSFTSPTGGTLPYRLMPPENAVPGQRYPLLVALHGLGGKGTDNLAQLNLGSPQLDPHIRTNYPSFTLLPQGSDGDFQSFGLWGDPAGKAMAASPTGSTRMTLELIDHLLATNPAIDPARVYLVGESMGGSGVFEMLARRPDLFACGLPVYLGGTPDTCSIIADHDIPLRLMNNDQSIPWSRDRLLLLGADVAHIARLTGNTGHGGYTVRFAYENYALWKWMFAQRKNGPRVRVRHTNGSTVVTEYGPGDTVEVWLKTQPSANVTVTALPDDQLTVTPSSLTFSPTNWHLKQTLAINAVNDAVNEGSHPGLLRFQAASADPAYQLPPVQSLDATVVEGSAQVAFTTPVWTVKENAGSVVLQVRPLGSFTAPVSVQYASAAGTASAGADFTAVSGTLNWTAGDDGIREITVPILNDSLVEGGQSFTVVLSNPVGIQLGTVATAEVRLLDGQSPGVIRLQTNYNATVEDQQSITFTALREEGYAGPASVRVLTLDGTAKAGPDYTALDARLSWPDGVTTPIPVTVNFADDTVPEPAETFRLALTEPLGATLAEPSSDTITLADNDGYTVGLEDAFTDGDRTQGTAWLYEKASAGLTVATGGGLAGALSFNSNNNQSSLFAALPQTVSLAQAGDYIEVTFRYSRNASPSFHSGLRVGFFQLTAPPSADNFGTALDPALGYLAAFASGSNSNSRLTKDTLTNDNLLNDAQNVDTGRLLTVTDSGLKVPLSAQTPDLLPATIRFRLERTGNGVRLTAGMTPRGGSETVMSIVDAASPLVDFNLLGFGVCNASQINYWDDIAVTTGGPSYESPNTAPLAVADIFEVLQHGAPLALPVLRNDSDADGDGLIISAASSPSLGSVQNQNTRLWYSPPATAGTDSFTYTVSDARTTSTATVTITVLADADASGLPDTWESAHGLLGADPAADPDGDGLPSLLEYALGTAPNSAQTSSPVSHSTFGDHLTLTFTPAVTTGLLYIVETSNNLSIWPDQTDVTDLLQVGQPFTFTDSANLATTPRRFLRLRVMIR